MRSIHDLRKRWRAVFEKYDSTASLKHDSTQRINNPCELGLRSICWRIFLLYADISPHIWIDTLRSERSAYSELHQHYLKDLDSGFEAPDVDPLAEDDSNPYEIYRRDQELRQEILQDVERCMPENTFFREPSVQSSLLDILFIFCKLNQDVSYRQGFHELVAVIYWVVSCDAISTSSPTNEDDMVKDEAVMREALDRSYIEHDTFSLFRVLMRAAKAWYELDDGGRSVRKGDTAGISPIVQKSRYIHETLLMATDPELGEHLKSLDVLPQVFLIRWIRLLFSREFPFDELLNVWDFLFAEDPDLLLVDLVCVSMLLRIRWKLIKADYSTALTLVLRYPSPSAPHLPVTFAEDAQYLHNNLNFEGGRHIITLYSHRQPTLHQPRIQVTKYNRSKGPLSPAIFQAAQIESIVQDVAKNVMDRSEKWGVNRAVREAVVEVRKNVQGYHQQPQQQIGTTNEEILTKRNLELTKALQVQEERNRQMARILDTGIELLSKEYPGEGVEGGFGDGLNRLTHVKECLLDTSKPLDKDLLQPRSHLSSPLPLTSPTTSRRPSHTHSRQSSTSEAFVKTSFKNNSDPDFLTQAQRPRTTLAQSSFAWMLGDDPASKHRSGFVTSKKGVGKKGSISSTVDILSGDSANIVGEGGLLLDLGNNGFDLGNFRKEK